MSHIYHLPVPVRQRELGHCCVWIQSEVTGICTQEERLVCVCESVSVCVGVRESVNVYVSV